MWAVGLIDDHEVAIADRIPGEFECCAVLVVLDSLALRPGANRPNELILVSPEEGVVRQQRECSENGWWTPHENRDPERGSQFCGLSSASRTLDQSND